MGPPKALRALIAPTTLALGVKGTRMVMFLKLISIFAVLLFPSLTYAEEYLLNFMQKCSSDGKELKYTCGKTDDYKHYIYKDKGIWKARTLDGVHQANFKLLREDENILALEQITLYSGNQTVYIMKKNNQFYLIQVAYSDILKNNETTTKQGIFIRTN